MTILEKLKQNLNSVIIGKQDVIDKFICGVLAGGHILLEDVPGTGKTTLARAFAQSFEAKFKRVQFTPDLLPSDITGITVFDLEEKEFKVKFGPIFTNLLLADEINRGTPKAQSALLEAMQEYKVTIDGVDYHIEKPFVVIATQNPIEYEGTFPLPEAQVDRFSMRFSIGYPDAANEKEMLRIEKETSPIENIEAVGTISEFMKLQSEARKVFIHEVLLGYIVELSNRTRKHRDVYLGVSPRGSIFLMRVAQARAFMNGRNFVLPDDIKKSVLDVFNHRVMLKADAKLRGLTVGDLLTELVESVPVPKELDFSK